MSLLPLCPPRAESGKTGCFSPKISRKEMVRRSLRLKFGLGKSNREIVSILLITQSSCYSANLNPKFWALLFSSRKDLFGNGGITAWLDLLSSTRNPRFIFIAVTDQLVLGSAGTGQEAGGGDSWDS